MLRKVLTYHWTIDEDMIFVMKEKRLDKRECINLTSEEKK